MSRWWAAESQSEQSRVRAELRDWFPAIALIFALGVIDELSLWGSDGSAELAWSLASVLPALWIVWAAARGIRRADEFQRSARLVAAAIAFAFLLIALYVALLLEAADVGDFRRAVQLSLSGSLVIYIGAVLVKTKSS